MNPPQSSPRQYDKMNPPKSSSLTSDREPDPADLSTRQIAAARLVAMGRSGRAVAAEVGVNEHTITRWRRTRRFDEEVRRQHALVLAEQVRQRRAESADAHALVV